MAKKLTVQQIQGLNIRILRQYRGLSQSALALLLDGFTEQTVRNIEHGRRDLSLSEGHSIAKILCVNPAKLMQYPSIFD